jgi:tetratricopeptide (TPR) repeat protein
VIRRSAPRLAFLLGLLALARPGASDDPWVRVRSTHFEVLSNASGERARATAARLEQFRRVMAAVLQRSPEAVEPPVVVLAFRDESSFAPFLPLYHGRPQEAAGFFQSGQDRDYIAVDLDAGGDDPYGTVYHEYAHVLLNRTLSAQPLWVAEGLAEVFSRWEASTGEVRVGQPARDHLQRLRREKPLPLARLLQIDSSSPLYNEGEQRGIFYAQSWALAHWALFGRPAPGAADLQAFLSGVAAGTEPGRAFASAFGAALPAAEQLVAAYLAGPLPVARFDAPGIDEEVVVTGDTPSPAEVEYRLGDLLLIGSRVNDARRHLQRAVVLSPGFAPAHEALGHAALRQGHWEEARREVRLALAADPEDAVALFRYADMIVRETAARSEVMSDEREAEAVAALERAVALAPQLADACELLARLRPEPSGERIAQVSAALARDPGRADLGLTGLYVRRSDFTSARAALLRARLLARDDTHRFLTDHYLARLDRITAGTTEVKGTLVGLECAPGGALRFVVSGPAHPLRLEAPSASGVFLYGGDGRQVECTFTCGAQREPVRAWYRPAATACDGTSSRSSSKRAEPARLAPILLLTSFRGFGVHPGALEEEQE